MSTAIFVRLLRDEDKGEILADTVAALQKGRGLESVVYAVDPASFRQVPCSPFAYWVSEGIRRLFTELPPFECKGRTVKQGLATADDFRFVCAWWEVEPEKILDGANGPDWREEIATFQAWCRRRTFEGKRWVPFAKGGEYSPYYADLHLVVNWENDGEEIKSWVVSNPSDPNTTHWSRRVASSEYYFRSGLTWPKVTISGLSVRPMPAGCIFSVGGLAAFPGENLFEFWLAFCNCRLAELLMRVMGAWHNWEAGTMKCLPVSSPDDEIRGQIIAKVRSAISEAERVHSSEQSFGDSWWICDFLDTEHVNQIVAKTHARVRDGFQRLRDKMVELERLVLSVYSLDEEELEQDLESLVTELRYEWTCDVPIESDIACNILSLAVGIIFGRWDIRLAMRENGIQESADPFSPMPISPRGMLLSAEGVPTQRTPDDYPLRIDQDGILVDDAGHPDDIVLRVREVLEVLWKDYAEAIEHEACEILGVKEVRDYFRKPGNSGFWMDHVKRYSKSRRKAPIYWLLQSSKKNYALWIYYHRLDKDILFKALINYVEPKLRLEEDRLQHIRTQRASTGSSRRQARQLEKQLDRQEGLLSELRDFRDKLRRTADLHLEPDLNDGVVLTIAPLWELVPWSEAKKYWHELLAGKYDWSSIGKQLRDKGLVGR